MANERLPERSIPDRSPGHAFIAIAHAGWRRHTKSRKRGLVVRRLWVSFVLPLHLPWIPAAYRGKAHAFDRRKDEKRGLCGFGPGPPRAPRRIAPAVAFVLGGPSVGAAVWT